MERNKAQSILNNGFIHTVKNPLWQNIPMTKEIKALTEVEAVQKLARIKQNGPTYHIYPGAVHTRLSHSIGVYYLGRQILLSLAKKSDELPFTEKGIMSFLAACLLHDIGHFPYAHSLKELSIREHEEIAGLRTVISVLRHRWPAEHRSMCAGEHAFAALGLENGDSVV